MELASRFEIDLDFEMIFDCYAFIYLFIQFFVFRIMFLVFTSSTYSV